MFACYAIEYNTLYSHAYLSGRAVGYSSAGLIAGVPGCRNDEPTVGPSFAVGSVVGCAVDLQTKSAYFTLDGKVMDVMIEESGGMLYGVVRLPPRARVMTKFGAEPPLVPQAEMRKGMNFMRVPCCIRMRGLWGRFGEREQNEAKDKRTRVQQQWIIKEKPKP